MEPVHSETGDYRVEPPASILVARLSMSHLVPLLEFNHLRKLLGLESIKDDAYYLCHRWSLPGALENDRPLREELKPCSAKSWD
jgi:hypothetical protein